MERGGNFTNIGLVTLIFRINIDPNGKTFSMVNFMVAEEYICNQKIF